MPNTPFVEIVINNQKVDIASLDTLGLKINYSLAEPENFESKQGSDAIGLTLPATRNNDQIFNTYHNPAVEDLSGTPTAYLAITLVAPGTGYTVGDILDVSGGTSIAQIQVTAVDGSGGITSFIILTYGAGYTIGDVCLLGGGTGTFGSVLITAIGGMGSSFRNLMQASINVNGTVPVLRGLAQLTSASRSDKPEEYNLDIQGGNGEWITNMQNTTLWDCLCTTPHTFDVATVELSWAPMDMGGYDSDEDHDYVYAPVRYRQPFGVDDNSVDIYMLRPSISIYWMIIRAFRQFGFTIQSEFLNSQYFRRMVLPWVWGSFYDINSQITDGLKFKSYGLLPTGSLPGSPTAGIFYTGNAPITGAPVTTFSSLLVTGTMYVISGVVGGETQTWEMPNIAPPDGYDNFGLYSFNSGTGEMQYDFNPPAILAPFIGSNVTLNFTLSLYVAIKTAAGSGCDCQIESYINGVLSSSLSILPGGAAIGASSDYPCPGIGAAYPFLTINCTPTVFTFPVTGVDPGDTLTFKLKLIGTGATASTAIVMQAGYLDARPSMLGANDWQKDFTTGKMVNIANNTTTPDWQETYSTFEMTGLQIVLGGQVNFQWYDAFRNYTFLSMFKGLVEMFDLEVQTNSINRVVAIEPFAGVTLPDYDPNGEYTGDIDIPGYFDITKVLDWTNKRDVSKAEYTENFRNYEKQIDFSFKQDGSDGGQNIFTARYKGLNMSKVVKGRIQEKSGRIDNGLVAAVPAASRYMLTDRFLQGNRQKSNGFFSATMHYKHTIWKAIGGASWPAPQLICIIPENINDSSASAVTQTFEPKIAFYSGLKDPAGFGGWRWIGDPSSPYTDGGSPSAIAFYLPFMFSVNYNDTAIVAGGGNKDPILSYSDQYVFDNTGAPVVAEGLMKKYFLRRLAIMRNGQLYNTNMRLNLNDICNFEHREILKVDNSMYALINIDGYEPLNDDSCKCTMWKYVSATDVDIANCYPSNDSITTNPTILTNPYDLKYAQLLLFMTDIPQV